MSNNKDSARNFNKAYRPNFNQYAPVDARQKCLKCREYKDKEEFRARSHEDKPFHSYCADCREWIIEE